MRKRAVLLNWAQAFSAIRVASSMEGKRGRGLIENSFGGRGEQETWGRPAAWCHYTGPVGDVIEGIGVFDHPHNLRYPTNWHVRDYGLFAANPFGWHDFGRPDRGDHTIPEGRSIRFGYRLILHTGDTASCGLPGLFEAYARPPAVVVQAE